ncbi:ABC transporter substrate-binding protein, partial [Patescibacteria group bacterium]|nr:ABC transporter substrate-binding protein [Patescibacteria group bacterium]
IAVTQNVSNNYGVSRYPEEDIVQVKRVGVPRIGGAFHISIIPVLQTLGVDVSKVEYVTMGVPISSRIALLERGEIDFTLIASEDIDKIDSDKFDLIPSEKIYKDTYEPRGVITTQESINKKSKEIQLYVDVMAKALKYIYDNKDEVVDYFSSTFEMTGVEARAYYEEIRDVSVDKGFVPEEYILESLVSATIDLANPKNPNRNLGEFIDTSFAEKAKKLL